VDSAEATGVKWAAGGGGGLTNITETLHTASPNNTVNAEQLAVTGGTTNVDLVLTPKGTGAFIVGPVSDGSAGGNKRGINAVDLQVSIVSRTNTRIASGNYSFIGAGNTNTASGIGSATIGGTSLVASGNYAVAINSTNTASGSDSFALGSGCTASGSTSIASGTGSIASAPDSIANGVWASAYLRSMRAETSRRFSVTGDAQSVWHTIMNKTTTNSAVELFIGGSAISQRLTIPSGKVLSATVNIVGVKSDGTAVARYLRQVTIKNVAGTTSLVGSVITLGTDEAAGTSVSITADDTNDALKIEVTGITSETWRWVATIEGAEVAYGN